MLYPQSKQQGRIQAGLGEGGVGAWGLLPPPILFIFGHPQTLHRCI